jgi:hypothetical protein
MVIFNHSIEQYVIKKNSKINPSNKIYHTFLLLDLAPARGFTLMEAEPLLP